MPDFRYRAYAANGRIVNDRVSAPSETDAVRLLMADGLTPFEIGETRAAQAGDSKPTSRKVTRGFGDFCRNLSAMLAGGLPLDEALKLLTEDSGDRRSARLSADVRSGVLQGLSLGEALAALRSPPPDYVLGLVRAGEEGGSVVPVLSRLADALDNQSKLSDAVRGALIYPVILLLTSLASVLVILLVVAPALEPVLRTAGQEPPMAAGLLLAAARTVKELWPVLTITPLVIVLAAMMWSRSAQGRRALGRMALQLPVAGPLLRDIEASRCLSSLSALLENGMSLVPALEVAAHGAGNQLVRDSFLRISGHVRTGERLSQAILQDGLLPVTAAQMAAVGELSADMPRQMAQAAQILEERSRRRIARMTSVAGPLLTLLLGVLIGGIVLTLLSAIMSVNDLAVQT
ncbi:MAG: type II secretion system F family protein [Hyphomonas sp.]